MSNLSASNNHSTVGEILSRSLIRHARSRMRATTALASAIMNVQTLPHPEGLVYYQGQFRNKKKNKKVNWGKEGF